MDESKKIGLTGGIASGKTTVSDYFEKIGAHVIDADVISHDVTKPDGSAFNEIISSFGPDILNEDGRIDRKKMRSMIFNDVSKKEMLEEIIHPKVSQEIFKAINQSNEHYLIISVPLLIETGMIQMMDRTLLVDCSETTQIERLMKRDEITLDAARSIMANQALRSDRQRFADDLILNEKNVTLKEIEQQVLELHKRYSKL